MKQINFKEDLKQQESIQLIQSPTSETNWLQRRPKTMGISPINPQVKQINFTLNLGQYESIQLPRIWCFSGLIGVIAIENSLWQTVCGFMSFN